MNPKILLAGAIIVVSILVGGYYLQKNGSSSSTSDKVWTVTREGLTKEDLPTITAPEGWLYIEGIFSHSIAVTLKTVEVSSGETPKAIIRADVVLAPLDDQQINEWLAEQTESRSKQEEVSNFSSEEISLSGGKGIRQEYDTSYPGSEVEHVKVLYVFKDGKRYDIGARTLKKDWPQYSVVINSALDSIEIP